MKRAPRLALFTDTYAPQVNGVARTLERLVAEVRARGGDVEIFTADDPGAQPRSGVHRYESIPFWGYPQLRLAAPRRAAVTVALRRFRPDIVHAATPFGVGLAGRSAAQAIGIPLVTSYHTSFTAYARHYGLGALEEVGWSYLRWFHNSGARTFCPTRAIAGDLTAHGFHDVRVWGRGVDRDRFSPTRRSEELRAALGVVPGGALVGYIGRIAKEKGLDVVVEAAERACALSSRPLHFVIAGDGPYLNELRERAAEAGAPITFTGPLAGDMLTAMYASLDVFVFPSVTDTFGNVLLEAAASGVSIVAAEAAPTRELVGEAAALLREDDTLAWSATIAALANDDVSRARRAAAALEIAAAHSWNEIFDNLFAEYRAVTELARKDGELRALA